MALARSSLGSPAPLPRAISRRAALGLIAASAAAACAPRAKATPAAPIAIIGGGTAGLTTAYRLASSGQPCAIYEASSRAGGRMFTKRDFNAAGQFCELGGELVDTRHVELIALAKEMGIEVERLRPADRVFNDLYDFRGKQHITRDLLDPAAGTGAFLPVAARIAADQEALLDANDEWTDRARELDAMSLSAYLAALRGATEDWVLDFIGLAYLAEYGLPLNEQSALNLVDFIGVDTAKPFEIYGESDEVFRIAGGSQSLPDALARKLGEPALSGAARINLRHELVSIARDAAGFTLRFTTPQGPIEITAQQVVMAIPFTRLRMLPGLGALGLSAEKMTAINTMGYGVNSKLMVSTKSRPWRTPATLGQKAELSGSIYTDRGFQLVWDTSAGQPGELGVLTNYLTGQAARGEEGPPLAALQAGLRELSPQLADALDADTRASFFWPRHPYTLGSYSAAAVGQYVGMFETSGAPELGGALLFAGEHTSPEHYGFMNGAVDSGERAAKLLLAAPAASPAH